MCPEEGGAAGLGELRSWWEVPAIAHFCSLFRTAFRLPDFEIEELEAALHRDDVEFISDLIACLLQGCYQRRDITFFIPSFHNCNLEYSYAKNFSYHLVLHLPYPPTPEEEIERAHPAGP